MKNFVRNILILIVIFLIVLVGYQKHNYDKIINGNVWKSNDYITHEYYCDFTKTYRIVNLLPGYVASVSEWSYVAVDQFQNQNVIALKVPSKLKERLKENNYYEFKYMIVGSGSINSMDDVNKYMTLDEIILNKKEDDVKVYLTINETNKTGLEQVNENICQSGQGLVFLD